MKFADKYEILEMVTSGRVSTFLARERSTQEAVVVYTFECVGTGAGELSTASIIARFCSLAPNPPGIIVKAGFDEPSSSAFITTKMPDPVALKAWVGAYQSFAKPGVAPVGAARDARPASGPTGDETAELSALEVRSVLAKSGPPPKPPAVENLSEDLGGVTSAFSLSAPEPAPPNSAGEFTRLFQEVNAFQPMQSSKPAAPAGSSGSATPQSPGPGNATDAMFGELLGGSPLGGERSVPAAPIAPAEASPGSFTREFLGLSSEKLAPPPAEPTSRQPEPAPWDSAPAKKEPGAFTREFMAVSQQDFKRSDAASKPAAPEQNPAPSFSSAFSPAHSPSPPSAPSGATTFESIFGGPSSQPAASAGGQVESKGGTGEFTSFFRDPFEHPGAPGKPIDVPDLGSAAPTKPPVGDFTKMFGRDDMGRGEPAPSPVFEPEPQVAAPGSFTEMFREVPSGKGSPGSQLGAATLGTNPNMRPSFLEPSGSPAPPEQPRGGMTSTPVVPPVDPFFSRTPPPVVPQVNRSPVNQTLVDQTFMNRPGSTTDVFRMPGGDAPPVEPMPSGPSEFTMFVSRSQLNASLPPEQALPSGNAGGAPSFAPPPPPNPFQFAPPPSPPPPAMKFQPAPAMPAAPAAPRPAVPGGAPKPGSIWPLVTVLTVLVAIGILLVMYFALKH